MFTICTLSTYHTYHTVLYDTVPYRIIPAQDVQLFNNGQRSITPFYIYSVQSILLCIY